MLKILESGKMTSIGGSLMGGIILDGGRTMKKSDVIIAERTPSECPALPELLTELEIGANTADDLTELPEELRRRVLCFLVHYRESCRNSVALEKSGLKAWQVTRARMKSKAFTALHDELREHAKQVATDRILETLEEMAAGERTIDPLKLPPDTKAASLLLPAYDKRFSKSGEHGGAAQVNIQINL